MLLLLFIVDRLVYHTVLLLCHGYHPAFVRTTDEMSTCLAFSAFLFFRLAQRTYNMYEDCCLLLYLNLSTYEVRRQLSVAVSKH